jgi:flagellar hook-associated protein 2
MTFRAGGIMSGLDSNSIIEQLVALERVPIQKLQSRQATLTAQKSLLTNIQTALSELRSRMLELDTDAELLAYQASSSRESALQVTASGAASPGTHTARVLQAARAEQDRSAQFASPDAEVKAGSLTLSVQGQTPVEVAIAEGDSLEDVAYEINRSGARVSAAVIDTGSGAYLTLYALDTGHVIGSPQDDAVQITESYTGATGSELGLAQTVQAQNAAIELDGLTVERRTNLMTDVLAGLELEVRDDTGQPDVVVKVEPDSEGLRENLQGFVDAYNKVLGLLHGQFVYTEGSTAGVMFGDGTLRGLMQRLQIQVGDRVAGSTGRFENLSAIGLKTAKDGTLSVDSAALEEAMQADFRGIAALFTTASSGLADRLEAVIDDYVDPLDGILPMRSKGIEQRYDNLDDQITRMEDRVTAYEERLVAQFTQLETVISQLKSQQSYLSSMGTSS